ncbi:MAG: GNAT family N-acetyltransferase [Kiloniellaceae bacterium]
MNASTIQPVGACDLAVLAELNERCFAPVDGEASPGTPWSARSLAEIMALPGVFGFLAVAEGVPVGFALAQVLFEEAELLTLGVAPPARRSGHGENLLKVAVAEASRRGAQRITLEVAEHNRTALTLYRRRGFQALSRRRNYYQTADGGRADAIILALELEQAGHPGP